MPVVKFFTCLNFEQKSSFFNILISLNFFTQPFTRLKLHNIMGRNGDRFARLRIASFLGSSLDHFK